MGEKMMKYYHYAKEKGGIQAQMRLAMKTALPSSKAVSEPDTPEILKKFHEQLKEILNDPNVPKF